MLQCQLQCHKQHAIVQDMLRCDPSDETIRCNQPLCQPHHVEFLRWTERLLHADLGRCSCTSGSSGVLKALLLERNGQLSRDPRKRNVTNLAMLFDAAPWGRPHLLSNKGHPSGAGGFQRGIYGEQEMMCSEAISHNWEGY